MSDLNHQYRNAPRLRSPATVDQRVLQAAEGRAAAKKSAIPRWSTIPAVSALCVAVFSAAVLLRQGVPPWQPESDITVGTAGNSQRAVASADITSDPSVEVLSPKLLEPPQTAGLAASAEYGVGFDQQARSYDASSITVASELVEMNDTAELLNEAEALSAEPINADTAFSAQAGLVLDSSLDAADASSSDDLRAPRTDDGKDWLAAQSAGDFTILVVTGNQTESGGQDTLMPVSAVTEVSTENGWRTALISGSFKTYEAAQMAIEKFGLIPFKPRIVTFDDISDLPGPLPPGR